MDATAFGGAHARVVRLRGEPERGQLPGVELAVLAGRRVDDAGLRLGGGALDDEPAPLGVLQVAADLQPDVGPVEAGDEDTRVAHAEPFDDVLPHRGRGGRGEREDRRAPEAPRGLGQPQVVGPEVVAPGGDALGLVHHEQRGVHLGQPVHHFVLGELLGRQVQEVHLALAHGRPGGVLLGGGQVGVDGDGRGAAVAVGQARDLVPLEGEERRDDHHRAGQQQAGDLVHGGLAGPGGHDDQGVPALQHPLHGRELLGTQLVPAEHLGGGLPQPPGTLAVPRALARHLPRQPVRSRRPGPFPARRPPGPLPVRSPHPAAHRTLLQSSCGTDLARGPAQLSWVPAVAARTPAHGRPCRGREPCPAGTHGGPAPRVRCRAGSLRGRTVSPGGP